MKRGGKTWKEHMSTRYDQALEELADVYTSKKLDLHKLTEEEIIELKDAMELVHKLVKKTIVK